MYYAAIDEEIKAMKSSSVTSRSTDELDAKIESDSDDLGSRYDLGLVCYKKGDFIKATKALEIFGQTQTYYFYEERAQLVLIMAYIKSKENNEANSLLKKMIKNKHHQYYDEAVKLQKGLTQ